MKKILANFGVLVSLVGCSAVKTPEVVKSNDKNGVIDGAVLTEESSLARHVVSLYDLENNGICTGTLIAKNIVLTAAHCVSTDPKNMHIIFKTSTVGLLEKVRDLAGQALPVELGVLRASQIEVREGYDSQRDPNSLEDFNDFAIVKLESDALNGYEPMALLESKDDLKAGDILNILGFGNSEADVRMVSKKDAEDLKDFQASISAYINLGILDPRNLTPADMNKLQWAVLCSSTDETISSEETYCTIYRHAGSQVLRLGHLVYQGSLNSTELSLAAGNVGGTCTGDSGGPLVTEKDGKTYLVGVASRASINCRSNVYYGDVTAESVKTWIQQVIEKFSN